MTDADLLDSVEKALAGDPRFKLVMPEVTIEKLAARLRRARESETRLAELLRLVERELDRLDDPNPDVGPSPVLLQVRAALKAMEDDT